MTVQVKNRSNGISVYTIPELGDRRNIRREFAPNEIKQIDLEELKALTYVPGGTTLLMEYLQVMDSQALVELGLITEPEYNMSKEDIKNLLLTGSMDSFLDCLDFAPTGVIDLIKNLSVSLPLNDSAKRLAIKEKTGFDVDKALMRKREAEEEEGNQITPIKERRVKQPESTPQRRAVPEYKVVSK